MGESENKLESKVKGWQAVAKELSDGGKEQPAAASESE